MNWKQHAPLAIATAAIIAGQIVAAKIVEHAIWYAAPSYSSELSAIQQSLDKIVQQTESDEQKYRNLTAPFRN